MRRFIVVVVLLGWILPLRSQESTNPPRNIPPSIVRVIDFNSNHDISIEVAKPITVTKVGTRTIEVDGRNVTESFTYNTTVLQLVPEQLKQGDYALVSLSGTFVKKETVIGTYVFYATSPDGIDKSFHKLMSPDSIVLLPVSADVNKPRRKPVLPPIVGDASAKMPDEPGTKDAPPEAEIKKLLEKQMWGPPQQGGTKHTYQYQSLKVGQQRQGNFRTDGVPANSKTMVYPVKVSVTITSRFTDGSTKQEDKNQSYVFFKDEFGDWTYRFKGNE